MLLVLYIDLVVVCFSSCRFVINCWVWIDCELVFSGFVWVSWFCFLLVCCILVLCLCFIFELLGIISVV